MVHRIARLVEEGVFSAETILATSFGKTNQQDMRRALTQWPSCAAVNVSTLHALGRAIVTDTRQRGLLAPPNTQIDIAKLNQHILNWALVEARKRDVPYRRELNGLDRRDFLDYISHNKGNLTFADRGQVKLPRKARKVTQQAEPPNEKLDWYLPFFQLYEEIRRKQNWITFDDMVPTGWELLQRHPELLAAWQARFQCVLVDEFQDINLAQSELLDLITTANRNYMAIGDDDQTIYQWRGAHPRYILDFTKRYKAASYLITDNFRCPAAPLILANEVIKHNRDRRPKQLSLTKGFDGGAQMHTHKSVESMASTIVDHIVAEHTNGRPWHDMAILVRLNAQTPHIEQHLIERDIPYRVSKPFYDRFEIVTLIEYCRLAWLEGNRKGLTPLTGSQRRAFEKAWSQIHNRPKRYIARELHDSIRQAAVHQQLPLPDALRIHAGRVSPYVAESLDLLAEDVEWLAGQLDNSADFVLRELDERLQFQGYLRDSSGNEQIGEGRAASVAAFIMYARGKGSLLEFMQHIRTLAAQRVGLNERRADAVVISTIHQAKGLEWPIVIVPQCDQGTLPFTGMTTFNLEEERRLFYVALTRTQEKLHLHSLKSATISQFLQETNAQKLLHEVNRWQKLVTTPNGPFDTTSARFVAQMTRRFGMQRYFEHYAQSDTHVAQAVTTGLARYPKQMLREAGLDSADVAFWQQLAQETT
jgi:DNA helicase-2/ATP-dependent DNA helicase PcrA